MHASGTKGRNGSGSGIGSHQSSMTTTNRSSHMSGLGSGSNGGTATGSGGTGGAGGVGGANKNFNKENKNFKSAIPSSAHNTRRRSTCGAGGSCGAGDGNTTGWTSSKSALYNNKSATARNSGGTTGNANATTTRLEQPTIASALRAAGNRLIVKKQQEKSAAASALIIKDKTVKLNRGIKWELLNETRGLNNASAVGVSNRLTGGGGAGGGGDINKTEKLEKTPIPATKTPTRSRVFTQRKSNTFVKENSRTQRVGGKNKDKDKDKVGNVKDKPKETDSMLTIQQNEEENLHKLEELAIQTNEAEILNHDLIIGDIKFMMPSKQIISEIEAEREREQAAKLKLETARRYDEFDEQQETHLTELQEFMERNCITKKDKRSKKLVPYQQPGVLKSMDEFFSREMPKSESITNIKERIKRKEQELLSLFDDVDVNAK